MRTDRILPLLLTIGCSDATVAKDYLALVSVSPDQGATQVAVNTTVIAGFSEALVSSSVDQPNVYITDSTGGPVVASVEYQPDAHWIMIDPESDLAPNSTYVVTFTSNIKGKRTGFLLAPVQTQFTTAGTNPSNGIPVANAGPDLEAGMTETVVLDGSGSTDPEGADLTYEWRLVLAPATSEAALSTTSQPSPTITVDREGEYIIGLTVNDGVQNSSEDFAAIRVLGTADDTPADTGTAEDTSSPDAPDTGE
jgi:hypothetical protein